MRQLPDRRQHQSLPERSWIFWLTSRAIKYFLLALLSFVLVCVVTPMLGVFSLIAPWVDLWLQWFGRGAVLIACLIVVSVVVESLRH